MNTKLNQIVLPNLKTETLFNPCEISFSDWLYKNKDQLNILRRNFKSKGFNYTEFSNVVVDGVLCKLSLPVIDRTIGISESSFYAIGFVKDGDDTYILISDAFHSGLTLKFIKVDPMFNTASTVSTSSIYFGGGIYGIRHGNKKHDWLDSVMDRLAPLPDFMANMAS